MSERFALTVPLMAETTAQQVGESVRLVRHHSGAVIGRTVGIGQMEFNKAPRSKRPHAVRRFCGIAQGPMWFATMPGSRTSYSGSTPTIALLNMAAKYRSPGWRLWAMCAREAHANLSIGYRTETP